MPPAEKPLDLGTGAVCASFDLRSAAWLSIGRPHDRYGFIELSAVPPFDERQRGDPGATRRHRLAMTYGEHAFLYVEVDGASPSMSADVTDPTTVRWSAPALDVSATASNGGRTISQRWSIRGRRRVRVVLRGSLDRPALAEITELDPAAPTGARTVRLLENDIVRLEALSLPAACHLAISPPVSWEERGDQVVGLVSWPGDDRLELVVEARMDGTELGAGPSDEVGTGDRIVDRALAYVRGCTALSIRHDERAFLTDHRILPLSWTRDAYWQALALLTADGPGDRERVADHLRWLWRRCERPDGRWVRSHHANGLRKDLAFQADQQLYPMIELADYWRQHAALPDGVDWNDEVGRAWTAALEEVDGPLGLIGCMENAADDPAVAPFIGASQVLLWYTAMRLAELADRGALLLDAAALRALALGVRAAFDAHVAPPGDAWAYAVDASGRRVAYHDANDLPIALAPVWGFCRPNDPGWRATMRFAFSAANPAWIDGDRPGLGSAHTAGPWTLGDIQAWLHGHIEGDAAAEARALARLEEVAFSDGMLPEAYSPDRTDDWRIRHWFAWPGAALAALRLLDLGGRLEERLSAVRTR